MRGLRSYGLWLSISLSAVLLMAGSGGYADAAEKSGKEAPLTVYCLDVGQGDSTLITTPAGKAILVDGGKGGPGYKRKDKAKTVIIPFLKKLGIKKLDIVIATHPDFDHIGGLLYLLENTKKGSDYPVEIGEFLDPGFPGTTYLYQDLLKAVKNRPEIKYRVVHNGEMLDFGKGVTAQVLAPDHIYSDANNSSIVIKITRGDVSFLLMGDAADKSEKDMIKNYGDKLRSTVLHAGHHGSEHSSTTEFLSYVKPKVVIISVGERNKFLLPMKEALARLEATGAKIYRTDYQGTITFTTDGTSYEVKAERDIPPEGERWDAVKVLSEEEKININTATADELRTLPRIGKVLSQRIIEGRPFKSVDELQRVNRIGPKIVARLRPLVTVGTSGERQVTAGKEQEGVTSIASITPAEYVKKTVTIQGKITSERVFREEKGRVIRVSDQTGTMDVLVWKNLYDRIPQAEKLTQGTSVKVTGEVDTYRGKLQIKPSKPEDIEILKKAPAKRETAPVTS
jgi:competence protein ComEC